MAMSWDAHINSEVLDEYALGRLSATESSNLEQHLLICEDCCRRLEETDRFLAAMRVTTATLGDTTSRVQSTGAGRKAAG